MKFTKASLLFITFLCLLLLVGCSLPLPSPEDIPFSGSGGFDDEKEEHTCTFSDIAAVPATCTENGYVTSACTCGKTRLTPIAATGHNIIELGVTAPTCTDTGLSSGEACSVCGLVISGREILQTVAHTPVIDEAVPPTANTPGKSEGSHCFVCGLVIVKQNAVFASDYTNPARYATDYAYEYLSSLQKGTGYVSLYDRIDTAMVEFHLSDINVDTDLLVAKVDYSDLGISDQEALAVWSAYRMDHPLYYWMSSHIKYTSEEIHILTYEEYVAAEIRSAYNARVYDAVRTAVDGIFGDDTYSVALSFHDYLIGGAYYAYESDGVTPEDAAFAHNILGVLLEGSGVCESYSKSFQLLLNYCGIDNVYVTGYAGEAHAWNLIKLDDGEWYWCDLTWDDDPDEFLGVIYNYFCVNDTQNLGWIDGRRTTPSSTFVSAHYADAPSMSGTSFMYSLPERSDNEFSGSDYLVRKSVFTVNGLTYSICGSGKVQLTGINASGAVEIPATVMSNGEEFEVVSIGAFKEGSDVMYDDGSVFAESSTVTELTIGENVIFIWHSALASYLVDQNLCADTLTAITVDTDNAAFTSRDGVLFTKSLYTLVQYPAAKDADSYQTPDETVQVASGAFRGLVNLKSLTFGKNVEVIGIVHYGSGYNDSALDEKTVTTSNNELPIILGWLAGNGRISFESGNSVYTVIGDGVYLDGGKRLLSALDTALTRFDLYSGVESVDAYALYYCTSVNDIYYNGSSFSWQQIAFGDDWSPYGNDDSLRLHFSDGIFQLTK